LPISYAVTSSDKQTYYCTVRGATLTSKLDYCTVRGATLTNKIDYCNVRGVTLLGVWVFACG